MWTSTRSTTSTQTAKRIDHASLSVRSAILRVPCGFGGGIPRQEPSQDFVTGPLSILDDL